MCEKQTKVTDIANYNPFYKPAVVIYEQAETREMIGGLSPATVDPDSFSTLCSQQLASGTAAVLGIVETGAPRCLERASLDPSIQFGSG